MKTEIEIKIEDIEREIKIIKIGRASCRERV